MARSRGHSKSQSTSSAVASPATRPSPVALKSATPARKPRRISQPLSPVSPASPGQFPPVRKQTQSAYWTYPVVVLTSFVISTALFSFVGTFTAGDLAAVSRRVDTLWEVGSVWLYRAVELGVYWFAGYDGKTYIRLKEHTANILPSFRCCIPLYTTLNAVQSPSRFVLQHRFADCTSQCDGNSDFKSRTLPHSQTDITASSPTYSTQELDSQQVYID